MMCYGERSPPVVPMQASEKLDIDLDELVDELEGRDGGLRKTKPKQADKLAWYVWRMARFHGGYDPEIPVTPTWWLQDYLDSQGIFMPKVTGVMNDPGQEIVNYLRDVVDAVLVRLGEDPLRAAEEWRYVLESQETTEASE